MFLLLLFPQGLFFNQDAITPIISMLPALLAKSASVYNPIIYAINHPKFRLVKINSIVFSTIRGVHIRFSCYCTSNYLSVLLSEGW